MPFFGNAVKRFAIPNSRPSLIDSANGVKYAGVAYVDCVALIYFLFRVVYKFMRPLLTRSLAVFRGQMLGAAKLSPRRSN